LELDDLETATASVVSVAFLDLFVFGETERRIELMVGGVGVWV
jgi:hypothetical protein